MFVQSESNWEAYQSISSCEDNTGSIMNRLAISIWTIFIIVNWTNASSEAEMFQAIRRIGEAARQTSTDNLRTTIQETLSAGSKPEHWSCVRSQTPDSYKEIHTSLNAVLDGLRSKFRSNLQEIKSMPQEKVTQLIEESVKETTSKFNARLTQIKNCVPQ